MLQQPSTSTKRGTSSAEDKIASSSTKKSAFIVPEEANGAEPLKQDFRNYQDAKEHVGNLYKLNHEKQTLKVAKELNEKYSKLNGGEHSVWYMIQRLNNITDLSDPDTELSQIQHAFQSAEAARRDNQPRWMQLVCLIHDLGKVLFLPPNNEPQEFVVGDTYPLGCAFSSHIVHPEYFEKNPDMQNPLYNSKYGIYHEAIGLENVTMSYGHDEYLYHVVKDYLPTAGSFVIRFHSFYSAHTFDDYTYLMNQSDHENMQWVKAFNKYDLYSKADETVDENDPALCAYYQELILEFFPEKIRW